MAATVIYRCKRCNGTRRIRYRVERVPIGYGRKESRYFKESDGSRGPGGEVCCDRPMKFGFLRATLNPAVKCNARCTHAVGWRCRSGLHWLGSDRCAGGH